MLTHYYTGSKTTFKSLPNCFEQRTNNEGQVLVTKQFSMPTLLTLYLSTSVFYQKVDT